MHEHPDILELELARGGEGDDTTRQHLESCDVCRAQLETLGSLGDALNPPDPGAIAFHPERESDMLDYISERAQVAQQHEGQVIPFSVTRFLYPVAAAAAAMLGLGLFIWFGPLQSKQGEIAGDRVTPGDPVDINRDGRIDILDAYLLASELESGQPQAPERDLNQDGKINGKDVDLIATRAVALPLEESS